MATRNARPYKYFLPTRGINTEQAQVDLGRVFGQSGETYSLQIATLQGEQGIYISASLELSHRAIARLGGQTRTPLEHLRIVESSAMMSPQSTQRVPMSAMSMYGSVGSSAVPESERHRASNRGSVMTPEYHQANQYQSAPNQYISRMSTYPAWQQYQDTAVETGYAQSPQENPRQRLRTDSSGGSGSALGPNLDALNDTFYFPPNVVSKATVEQRREKLRRDSNRFEEPRYR